MNAPAARAREGAARRKRNGAARASGRRDGARNEERVRRLKGKPGGEAEAAAAKKLKKRRIVSTCCRRNCVLSWQHYRNAARAPERDALRRLLDTRTDFVSSALLAVFLAFCHRCFIILLLPLPPRLRYSDRYVRLFCFRGQMSPSFSFFFSFILFSLSRAFICIDSCSFICRSF